MPLFVSRKRLAKYKRKLPDSIGLWSCDSGAFSELDENGKFTISSNDYAAEVKRYRSHVGNMLWAAPQDWMCEERVLRKTGKSIAEHQKLTVNNYLDLMTAAPNIPWIPVLQGWSFGDYLRCAELYETAGISLKSLPLVGLGSVCRRQNTLLRQQVEKLEDESFRFANEARCLQEKLRTLPTPEASLFDVSVLRDKIADAQTVNRHVEHKRIATELAKTIVAKQHDAGTLTQKMADRDKWKVEAIASARMPVAGLGFGNGYLTFNSVPLSQASGAQKIKIACAIAMAANPKLKVLRIQDGSILDDASREVLRELAETHGYQVWIELLKGGPEAIVLEDGHVAE